MPHSYISTEDAPGVVGPYSQAVKTGNIVFVSGQLPLEPATGKMVGNDAAGQAEQCMNNVLAILNAESMTASDIVKITIYLKDMNDFGAVNEVYAGFFDRQYPARTCVEVARLPKDALIEIEAIAAG